uniref:phosphoserine transaminase n=3 Tax=Eptatretus burgeri TaxID=7764 RepID=A0A8C4QS31_EPTBU
MSACEAAKITRSSQSVSLFNAGPAKLPRPVLLKLQKELLDYNGLGYSIMELSHRSAAYARLNADTEQMLRESMSIPCSHAILFMHGGGTGQFSAIPLNFMETKGRTTAEHGVETRTADYVVTGLWSSKAAQEAKKFGHINMVCPVPEKFTYVPEPATWAPSIDASYLYYCANETIHGVEFPEVPTPPTPHAPLVADISSNFLSRPMDVSKLGLAFAGAQKNAGCAGLTIVIVQRELLGRCDPRCPVVLDYGIVEKHSSVYNTPPVWSLFVFNQVLKWIQETGGLPAMEAMNKAKSKRIFDAIDQSGGFYSSAVEDKWRSRMNIPFRVGGPNGSQELETAFLTGAEARGMVGLKGHRSMGGIRASLYNAVTEDEVFLLSSYMEEFMSANR